MQLRGCIFHISHMFSKSEEGQYLSEQGGMERVSRLPQHIFVTATCYDTPCAVSSDCKAALAIQMKSMLALNLSNAI